MVLVWVEQFELCPGFRGYGLVAGLTLVVGSCSVGQVAPKQAGRFVAVRVCSLRTQQRTES